MTFHRHAIATVLAVSAALLVVTFLRSPRYSGPDAQALRFIRALPLLTPGPHGEVLSLQGRGPHGELPATVKNLVDMLALDDIRSVRARRPQAAICMQDVNNDWSRLQLVGIKQILERCGVEILATTDGEFDVEKQLADYANVIELHPEIIVTIPLDTDRCAPVLKRAAETGIQFVFIDNVPTGLSHPADYAGMVAADSYANGKVAADALAERLDSTGQVALLHWSNRMFTCDQRSRAAREALSRYPDIEVVAEEYFEGSYEVERITRSLLREHKGLDGLWVVWDTPALEAAREIKRQDRSVPVATVDLGADVARSIAHGGVIFATGAQHPYEQGLAAGITAVVALAGKEPPAYVAIPGERVTKPSLSRALRRVFRNRVPLDLLAWSDSLQ